jgi:hypothetical protein
MDDTLTIASELAIGSGNPTVYVNSWRFDPHGPMSDH